LFAAADGHVPLFAWNFAGTDCYRGRVLDRLWIGCTNDLAIAPLAEETWFDEIYADEYLAYRAIVR